MNFDCSSHSTRRPTSRRRKRSLAGFTLIELMAAMAVFSILLVMLIRVFTGTTKTFNAGIGLSKQTSDARLVLDYLAQQLQDSHFELKLPAESELKFYDDSCNITDTIRVEAYGPAPALGGSPDIKLIQERTGMAGKVPLLDHVLEFKVNVYDDMIIPGGATPNLAGLTEYPPAALGSACSNSAVVAVIYLETLSSQNAKTAQASATFNKDLFSQKYYRTVYLPKFLANKN